MQEVVCEGTSVSKLTTADIELHLKRYDELTFNDTDGHSIEEARELVRRRLELELRIRNMGLRS